MTDLLPANHLTTLPSTTSTSSPNSNSNSNSTPQSTSSTSTSTSNEKIHLRSPSIYQREKANENANWTPPDLKWLERTWSVTHSTLPMWRKAKRVKITYKVLDEGGKLDDVVSSEPTERTLLPQPKSIHGTDTPDPLVPAAWNWRGKGWLKIASSHWEILGWGEYSSSSTSTSSPAELDQILSAASQKDKKENEVGVERWVITWFAPSLFTPAGVDIYSDREEGGCEGLVKCLIETLEKMDCEEVAGVCKSEMRGVRLD